MFTTKENVNQENDNAIQIIAHLIMFWHELKYIYRNLFVILMQKYCSALSYGFQM